MLERERLLQSPAGKQWAPIGTNAHHGIVVPLFSARTEHSCGIGEFTDLIPLITWCKEIGLDVIQLLPLNDTGKETSPYSAISAFALNPIHLGLTQLPYLKQFPELVSSITQFQKYNSTPRVNYPAVLTKKMDFLQKYYLSASHHLTNTLDYQQFVKQNAWLNDYALYKSLKIANQWKSWEEWAPELSNISPEKFDVLLKQYAIEVNFHIFVQYLCFQQMQDIKRQATANGIMIKGDIPIFINRDSADVWLNRQLFLMEYSAGAPPDMYSVEGQNWGVPTYNWPEIEREDYVWWKERLRVASTCYHLYRIDHIVGFFHTWSIPLGQLGHLGKFEPEAPSDWIPHGEKIMRMMIDSCSMLPIGEDLGSVPTEVRECLSRLGICGTKVMRWERYWNEDKRFIPSSAYPVASMTTVSTHDSDTLKGWWRSHPDEAETFAKEQGWAYIPQLSTEHLKEILRISHHTPSIFHINLLQEYLAAIPNMTWPNPDDERINIPGLISDRNWTYRFRPNIEEITKNSQLRELMQSILKSPKVSNNPRNGSSR